jgi:hypothetical protein
MNTRSPEPTGSGLLLFPGLVWSALGNTGRKTPLPAKIAGFFFE